MTRVKSGQVPDVDLDEASSEDERTFTSKGSKGRKRVRSPQSVEKLQGSKTIKKSK
jgi:hypothetical protein